MKLAEIFALVACAGLLSAVLIGPAPYAHAQDIEQVYPRAGNLSAESSNTYGALCDDVDDKAEGAGSLVFIFAPIVGENPYETAQDGEEIEELTSFSFFWNDQNLAFGPMYGLISSKSIEFNGNAGDDCTVTGSGTGEDWNLSGKFKFHGKCAKFFEGGTFSGYIGCFVAVESGPPKKGWQASD